MGTSEADGVLVDVGKRSERKMFSPIGNESGYPVNCICHFNIALPGHGW